jgi:hypothetical protein
MNIFLNPISKRFGEILFAFFVSGNKTYSNSKKFAEAFPIEHTDRQNDKILVCFHITAKSACDT